MSTLEQAYDPINLSSIDFWGLTSQGREARFAELRAQRPVSWQPPSEGSLVAGSGYWAVVRHRDIVAVSKNPDVFSSSKELGGPLFDDYPPEFLEAQASILAMDDPRHGKLRRLVSMAFTPRRVARIEEGIRAEARRIVDGFMRLGDCDFVEDLARRLPTFTVSEMVGIPDELRDTVADLINTVIGMNDPEIAGDQSALALTMAGVERLQYIYQQVIEERRARPRDDLLTGLIEAEVDGQRLTDPEIRAFFNVIAVGGNDTSRNTTAIAMKALCDFPEQHALLLSDLERLMPAAVEEFIRWSSPFVGFRRTATRDVALHGRSIRRGEKVLMFYESGNRDETVFARPYELDITRNPNPHLSFGGGGPHYCLGAALARGQIRAILTELLPRARDIELGDPSYMRSNLVNAIKRMPCRFTPETG